jgi:hypothetical protein
VSDDDWTPVVAQRGIRQRANRVLSSMSSVSAMTARIASSPSKSSSSSIAERGLIYPATHAATWSRSSRSRYGARYFAAILWGASLGGASLTSDLNPWPPVILAEM